MAKSTWRTSPTLPRPIPNHHLIKTIYTKNLTSPEGVIIHTDQGYHYHHQSWISQLVEHQCVQSMSRKGNCYDNSVMENFFSHLKEEMFNNDSFTSINELRIAVNQYIHWYNTERMQQRLGGMTPNEYRQHALTNTG